MCRRTTCNSCGKPDWAGCGAHIESVLGEVPRQNRCRCREDGSRQNLGFFRSLFGGGSKPTGG